MKILEEFIGTLDKIENDIAHITLRTTSNEVFYGEYPVSKFTELGIRENRRFKCRTIEVDSQVELMIESIPDIEISKEREKQIDDWIEKALGNNDD